MAGVASLPWFLLGELAGFLGQGNQQSNPESPYMMPGPTPPPGGGGVPKPGPSLPGTDADHPTPYSGYRGESDNFDFQNGLSNSANPFTQSRPYTGVNSGNFYTDTSLDPAPADETPLDPVQRPIVPVVTLLPNGNIETQRPPMSFAMLRDLYSVRDVEHPHPAGILWAEDDLYHASDGRLGDLVDMLGQEEGRRVWETENQVHGNYCGGGWSAGRRQQSVVSAVPATDALDEACRLHDFGYVLYDEGVINASELYDIDRLFYEETTKPGTGLKSRAAGSAVLLYNSVMPRARSKNTYEPQSLRDARARVYNSLPSWSQEEIDKGDAHWTDFVPLGKAGKRLARQSMAAASRKLATIKTKPKIKSDLPRVFKAVRAANRAAMRGGRRKGRGGRFGRGGGNFNSRPSGKPRTDSRPTAMAKRMGKSNTSVRWGRDGRSATVATRDFVTAVSVNAQTQGTNITKLDLNPLAITGSRAANFAQLFENFYLKAAVFRYTPQCPTSTAGGLVMAVDTDPGDSANNVGAQAVSVDLEQGGTPFNIWESAFLVYKPIRPRQDMFITPGIDNRVTSQGTFHLDATNTLPGSTTAGLIWVDWIWEFYGPTYEATGIPSSSAVEATTSSAATATPFHLMVNNGASAFDPKWTDTTFTLPNAGMWLFTGTWFGGTISAAGATLSVTGGTGSITNQTNSANGGACAITALINFTSTNGGVVTVSGFTTIAASTNSRFFIARMPGGFTLQTTRKARNPLERLEALEAMFAELNCNIDKPEVDRNDNSTEGFLLTESLIEQVKSMRSRSAEGARKSVTKV